MSAATPKKLTPEALLSRLTSALPEGTEILLRATVGEPYSIEIRLDTLKLSQLSRHTRAELLGVLGEAGADPTFWDEGGQADWGVAVEGHPPESPDGEATAWLVLTHQRPAQATPDEEAAGESNTETSHPQA